MCMVQSLYSLKFIDSLSKYSLISSHVSGTMLDTEIIMGDIINWESKHKIMIDGGKCFEVKK